MTTTVAWSTHPGLVRKRNEDHAGVRSPGGTAGPAGDGGTSSLPAVDGPLLAVVADGLGGHPYGDVASRLAVESILHAAPIDADELVVAVHAANAELYTAMDDPAKRTMGTTVAAALVHGDGIAVVNVGDSPVYQLVDGELLELSVMDSLSSDDDPHGLHANVVTQTLGGTSVHEDVTPHLVELHPDETLRLLLCTDGLTNYVEPSVIAAALGAPDPSDAASALVDLALAGGGGDNVTVVVLDVT